jgi:CheY-like chemotaxis protein
MEADLLSEEVGGGPLVERAAKITRAAERSARIVKNFLALARQRSAERLQVAFNDVVEEAVELLAYALRVDDIEVCLRLAEPLPILWADPHQLHQVIVNLITNAHQALRDMPAPRRLSITTSFDPTHTRVRLEVADTGPGIPPALQARVFEPFFTTKPPGVGTGLGLSLCQGIVEGHGGTISLESLPGRGTLFRVELPVESAPAKVPETPQGITPLSIQPKAILAVDDEPGITGALAYLLSRSGHQVETAANGRIALERLQQQTYDLILSDLRMPELDGVGFYRALEHSYPQLLQRVIFLTGDTLSPETRELLAQNRGLHLNKPFTAAEVRRVVQQALQGTR